MKKVQRIIDRIRNDDMSIQLNRMSGIDAATAATIAELPRIVGFRNVLIHGYASVDNRIVWGIVESDLVSLRKTLEVLIEQE